MSTGFSADYPQGTGVPGPGVFRGGVVDFTKTGIQGPETFATFGCKVFKYSDPLTPDWETAQVYFQRKIFNDGKLKIAALGIDMPYWGFEDTLRAKGKRVFPSPMMRLRVGELAHVLMQTRFGEHTIHHHGIEPSTMNDGVGHVSFETSDEYVYQWRAKSEGSYFYHCHVNTVLHFKMGLYGLLIIDPEDGWGRVYKGARDYTYDVEKIWVMDDRDPRYHSLDRQAGLCGDDVGLNIWKPQYFFINGVHKSETTQERSGVPLKARLGQKVLFRILNGSYSVARVTVEDLPFECVSIDGHSLVGPINGSPADRPWSKAYAYAANEPMIIPTAGRFDLWFDTEKIPMALRSKNRFKVTFEYLDWVTKRPHNATHPNPLLRGVSETYIDIAWSRS